MNIARRPLPFWAFVAAFAVQAAFLGYIIVDRALLLARGTEIRLNVVPIDPRDFFRGDYVVLSYSISRLDAGQVGGDDDFGEGEPVFVALRKDGDTWTADSLQHTRPSGAFGLNGVVTRVTSGTGRCGNQPCNAFFIDYELERFFVPEGKGKDLERARNDRRMQVDIAVGGRGRAAVKRLLVDGAPVFQETFF